MTAGGKHVAFGVPGDVLAEDGTLVEGPGHRVPPCRHFPTCGGCQLQHLTDEAYTAYCRGRVDGALEQHGITAEIREAHLSPPRSRRRASLKVVKAGGRVLIGFNAAKTNQVVDLTECHVLRHELFGLLPALRALYAAHGGKAGEAQLTLADQGVDVALKGLRPEGLAGVEALSDFCEKQGLARLSLDEGYGPETRFEPQPVTVKLGQTAVPLPVGAFLQATADGEGALVATVREAVGAAKRPIDLFAGLGTFALALDGQVSAAEASRDAILALKRAAPSIDAQHRDLYRRPYDADELAGHDAVVLDPPRSGAEEQVKRIAESAVPRIAYVSCNPATFARDAAILVGGGYRLDWVRPVGQFRWSTHVELASQFTR